MFKIHQLVEISGDSCFFGKVGKILDKTSVDGGSSIYWVKFSDEEIPYWFLESEIKGVEQ